MAMNYNTFLFAIEIDRGKYAVSDQCEGAVNIDLLKRLEKLQELEGESGPREYMAILMREEVPSYYLEEGHVERRVVQDWVEGLSDNVLFVMVHRTTRDLYSKRRDKGTLHRYVKLNAGA